jgi:SAM-dependent methyltransferase
MSRHPETTPLASIDAAPTGGPPPCRADILRAVLASHYNQPATALWRTVEIEAILRHVRFRGRILDLGCGDGGIGALVIPPACPMTGIDLSPEDLALARATGRYEELVACDASAIPFPDGSFDMVFSNSVLEHIPHLDGVLSEAARLLRSGGELVITVPSDRFLELLAQPARLRAAGQAERARAYVDALNARVQHFHYLGPDDWRARLAPVGLEVVQAEYYLDRQTLHAWETWHNRSAGVARRLTGQRLSTRDIQRRWGLTSSSRFIPRRLLARGLALALGPSLRGAAGDGEDGGAGLLVRAIKAGDPSRGHEPSR